MKQVNTNIQFHIANVITFLQSTASLVFSGSAGYGFFGIAQSLVLCRFQRHFNLAKISVFPMLIFSPIKYDKK